jgi:tetraacyldisaccharide 4'-kinase
MLASWRPVLEGSLLRIWSRRSWAAAMLLPISMVFLALALARRALYHRKLLQVQRADAFVIVVGNVVVGGGGKTPTVVSIAQHLSAQGHFVGIVSRGFGRNAQGCQEVFTTSQASDVGDEPLLIKRSTELPVFVCKDRYQAANTLLSQYPRTQIILCDDGLQHYRLYRNLEVCVFDERGCGNHFLLPAGFLREPWPRRALEIAGQQDRNFLVLHTGNTAAFSGYRAHRSLHPLGLRADGTSIELLTLSAPDAPPLMALAGIAHPQSFFSMLRALGLPLSITLALPDHYSFEEIDPQFASTHQLLCTEKDAVKLWKKAPTAIAVQLLQTIEPAFFAKLDECLAKQAFKGVGTPLSLGHGHQTS